MTKRFFTLLLTAVLALSLWPAASAAEDEAGGLTFIPDSDLLFQLAVSNDISDATAVLVAEDTPRYGDTLTLTLAGDSISNALADGALTYQWQRASSGDANADWQNISGAVSARYILSQDDIGCYIRAVLTATGDYSGTVVSGHIGPVSKLAYSGNAPVASECASPTDLTITASIEEGQEYVAVPYGDGSAPAAPTDAQWAEAHLAASSGWLRFRSLTAGTRYALWTRFPGSAIMEASEAVYTVFTTSGTPPEDPEAWVNPFTDVSTDDWFYDSVAYVCQNNLFQGMSDTEFGPGETSTRAMVVTVLWRLEGSPSYENAPAAFSDVETGQWYSDAVAWAVENDIVVGYDDNTFKPFAAITREQLATILYRYADYSGVSTAASDDLGSYTDASTIQSYARDAVAWAVGSGIISGMTESTLEPGGSAIRAQLATMLYRFLNLE